jgi:hypothetical protein
MRGGASSREGSALIVAVTGRNSGAVDAAADCSPTIVFQEASAAVRRSSLALTVTNFGASAARGRSGLAGRVAAAHAQSVVKRQTRESVLGVRFMFRVARLKLMKGKRSGRIILKNVRRATSFDERRKDTRACRAKTS